jgi:hypothetical protein
VKRFTLLFRSAANTPCGSDTDGAEQKNGPAGPWRLAPHTIWPDRSLGLQTAAMAIGRPGWHVATPDRRPGFRFSPSAPVPARSADLPDRHRVFDRIGRLPAPIAASCHPPLHNLSDGFICLSILFFFTVSPLPLSLSRCCSPIAAPVEGPLSHSKHSIGVIAKVFCRMK